MHAPKAVQELLLYYLKCIHALDFDAGILDVGVTKSKITKTCNYYVKNSKMIYISLASGIIFPCFFLKNDRPLLPLSFINNK